MVVLPAVQCPSDQSAVFSTVSAVSSLQESLLQESLLLESLLQGNLLQPQLSAASEVHQGKCCARQQ